MEWREDDSPFGYVLAGQVDIHTKRGYPLLCPLFVCHDHPASRCHPERSEGSQAPPHSTGWAQDPSLRSGCLSRGTFSWYLEQTYVIRQITQIAKHAAITIASIFIVVSTMMRVFNLVQEHLTTDHSSRSPERADRHIAAASLQETAEAAALLSLLWHIRRYGNDSREAGTTAWAIGCPDRRHRHANGAAQHHWLLTKHWLLLITRRRLSIRLLRIGLLVSRLLWRVLRVILRLAILRRIRLQGLTITSCLWIASLWSGGRSSINRAAASATEIQSRGILSSARVAIHAAGRRGYRGWSSRLHILSAIGAECCAERNICVTGRALTSQ